MGLRINTNVPSLVAQRSLAQVTQRIGKRFQRLATGLRIVTAADDPAGLAMSERMRARIRSLDQAKRNAFDGISLAATAEGSLNEVSNILARLRELAIQSANGTVSNQDRTALQAEFSGLVDEVDRIARSTEFNGKKLLDGSVSSITFAIGADGSGINFGLSSALSTTLSLASLSVGPGGDISTAVAAVDAAINNVSGLRGTFGAMQNRLQSSINHIGNEVENLTAAESRIRDLDYARETAELVKDQILQQAAIAMLAQANSLPQLALTLIQGASVR